MATDTPATAAFALAVSIITLYLLSFLDHSGTATTAQAPPVPLASAMQLLLAMAGIEGLIATVGFIYGHMHRARAGAVNRPIAELVTFIMCASVGLLLFVLFVQPAGGADDDGAQADRALGAVAVRALPAAATATFFSGVMLMYAYVGNGVGAGGGAVAGDGLVPEPAVSLLAKITLGAAASVVILMAMAFYTN